MRTYWILLGCCLGINAWAVTKGDRFYANPPIVSPGAPLQLHWNVSDDDDARCAPSGGDETIWRELGDLPGQDWEWFNAPRTIGRHTFTLHCDINGKLVQISAFVQVRIPSAEPFFGATRSPWQEVPEIAAAGLRAASRPATGGDNIMFEADGRLAGYSADNAERSALIYDPGNRLLSPLQTSPNRKLIPGSSVASAVDVSAYHPAVASSNGTLWWGFSLCPLSTLNCPQGVFAEPLRGVSGLTSLTTQTQVYTPFLFDFIVQPRVAFDSTNRELTDDFVTANRNIYFIGIGGELSGVPQLVSKIGSKGIAFDGPSTRPVFTRQALRYVAAVVFETTASNVLSLQGVNNGDRQNQICGMRMGAYAPRHDTLFCVSRNRLTGEFGDDSSSNARAVTTVGNGVVVVFESESSNLIAGDNNGSSDVFAAALVADGRIKGPVRISVGVAGGESNGPSYAPSIAEDGQTLVFESDADNLVADDGNGQRDVFLLDLIDGRLERASTAVDGGDADGPSDNAEISVDGRVLFRSQASNLLTTALPNTQAIYFRQRLRHGGSSRPSFSELPLQAPDSGSTCVGGYHAFIVSDGLAQIHVDQNATLAVKASEETEGGAAEALASFSQGSFTLPLPNSGSIRTVDVVISAQGRVSQSAAEIKILSFEPRRGLLHDGSNDLYVGTTTIEPGTPLHVRAPLRTTDLSLRIQILGDDRYVVEVQVENVEGSLHLPVDAQLTLKSGHDPHSKIGGLLGLCLDRAMQIDAKLDSGWREESTTADLQLSIYDELGVLRYRAPDLFR